MAKRAVPKKAKTAKSPPARGKKEKPPRPRAGKPAPSDPLPQPASAPIEPKAAAPTQAPTPTGTVVPAASLKIAAWILPSILIQGPGASLARTLALVPAADRLKPPSSAPIWHIVNPYTAPNDIFHQTLMSTTFAAMMQAKAIDPGPTHLLTTQFAGDRKLVPPGFRALQDLDRTILDLRSFAVRRPLPLLFDILDRAATEAANEDYILFTNLDIAPKLPFYVALRELMGMGFDGIVINRRTVGKFGQYRDKPGLAAADLGEHHVGYDCFAFKASLYRRFVKNYACVGAGLLDRSVMLNLIALCDKLIILKDIALTFHYGDDQQWQVPQQQDYFRHNFVEAFYAMEMLGRERVGRDRIQRYTRKFPSTISFGTELPALMAAYLRHRLAGGDLASWNKQLEAAAAAASSPATKK